MEHGPDPFPEDRLQLLPELLEFVLDAFAVGGFELGAAFVEVEGEHVDLFRLGEVLVFGNAVGRVNALHNSINADFLPNIRWRLIAAAVAAVSAFMMAYAMRANSFGKLTCMHVATVLNAQFPIVSVFHIVNIYLLIHSAPFYPSMG
jgi:hypothetical protein